MRKMYLSLSLALLLCGINDAWGRLRKKNPQETELGIESPKAGMVLAFNRIDLSSSGCEAGLWLCADGTGKSVLSVLSATEPESNKTGWVLETSDVVIEQGIQSFYLKNYSSGSYLTFVDGSANPADDSTNILLTTEKSEAKSFIIVPTKQGVPLLGDERTDFGEKGGVIKDGDWMIISQFTTDGKTSMRAINTYRTQAAMMVYADYATWYTAYEMELDDNVIVNLQEVLEEMPELSMKVGTNPGCCSQELIDEYTEARNAVCELLQLAGESERDVADEAIRRLREANVAIKAGRVPLYTGYFRIINASPSFEQVQGRRYAMTVVNDVPAWRALGTTDANEIWYVTTQSGNKVTLQNVGNGQFVVGHNVMGKEPTDKLSITFFDNASSARINYNGGNDFHADQHNSGFGAGGNIILWNAEATNDPSTWFIEAVSAEEAAQYEAVLQQNKLMFEFKDLLATAIEKYNIATVYHKTGDGLITTVDQLSSNADHNALNGSPDGQGLAGLIDGDIHTFFHSLWNGSAEGAPDAYHNLTVDLKTTLNKFVFTITPRKYAPGGSYDTDPSDFRETNSLVNRPTEIVLYGAKAGADPAQAESWKKLQTITGLPDSDVKPANDDELPFTTHGYPLFDEYQYLRFDVTKTNNGAGIWVNSNKYPFFTMAEFQIYNAELDPTCQLVNLGEVGTAFEEAYKKALNVETPTQQDIDDLRAALQAFIEGGFLDITLLQDALEQWPALTEIKGGTNPGCCPQDLVDEYVAAREAISGMLERQNTITKESMDAAIARLNAAGEAVGTTRVPLTTGYYRIVNANPRFEQMQGKRYAMTTNGNVPAWRELGTTADREVWHITALDDGKVIIRNVGNTLYLTGPDINQRSAQVNVMSKEPQDGMTITFFDNASSARIKYNGGYDFHADNHGNGYGTGGNIVLWTDASNSSSAWYIEAVPADEESLYDALLQQNPITLEFNEVLAEVAEKYTMAAVYNKTGDGLITTVDQLASNADHNALAANNDGHDLSDLIDGDVHTFFHTLWDEDVEGAPDAYHNLTVDLKTTPDDFVFTIAPRKYTPGANYETDNTDFSEQTILRNRPTEIILYGAAAGADISLPESWRKLHTITGLPEGTAVVSDEELTFTTAGYPLFEQCRYLRFEVTKTNSSDNITVNGHAYPFFTMAEFQIYNAELLPTCQLVVLGEVGKAFEAAYKKALGIETPTRQDIDDLRAALQAFTEGGFIDMTVLEDALEQWPALTSVVRAGTGPGCFPQELIEEYNTARDAISNLLKQQEVVTQEKVDAAIERLRAADEVIEQADRVPVTTGYYRLVSANTALDARYAMAVDDEQSAYTLVGLPLDAESDCQVWYITKQEGSKVTMRSVCNGRYVGTSDNSYYPGMIADPADEVTIAFFDKASSARIKINNSEDLNFGYGTIRYQNGSFANGASAWFLEALTAEEAADFEARLEQNLIDIEFKELLAAALDKYNTAAVYNKASDGLITAEDQLSTNADHNALNETPDGQGLAGLIDGDIHTFFHSLWNGSAEGAPDAYHNLTVDLKQPLNKMAFTMTARRYTPGANYETDKTDFREQNSLNNRPREIIFYGAVAGADISRPESWKKIQAITGLPSSRQMPESDEELTFTTSGCSLFDNYQYLRFEVTKTNNGESIWVNGNRYPFFTMAEFQIYNVEMDPDCQMAGLGEVGRTFGEACKRAIDIVTPTRQDIEDLRQAIYDFENTRKIDLRISNAGFATLMLPYDAALPEGVKAYSTSQAEEASADGCRVLTLVEADALQANTPYIIEGVPGTYTFSGAVTNTQDTYTNGWLTGTFVARQAQAGTYVLQNNNGITGFYRVATGKEPHVGANRVWLSVPTEEGGAAEVTAFVFGDDSATGIEGVEMADRRVDVYTLEGVCVRTDVRMSEALKALPRGVYVVSGTKKAVK